MVAEPQSAFVGRWHVTTTWEWDTSEIEVRVKAAAFWFIEFDTNGKGVFQIPYAFAYGWGSIDYRPATRHGEPAVEWSWSGAEERDPAVAELLEAGGENLDRLLPRPAGGGMHRRTGRGWAVLRGDQLLGMICSDHGGDYGFLAKRAVASNGPKGKCPWRQLDEKEPQ
jgi:hypothetical protein